MGAVLANQATQPAGVLYTPADFELIRRLVHDEAGIVLAPAKATLVYSRLAALVRRAGSGSFAEYLKLIENNPAERQRTIAALTTNHTFFFRENHHFEHFRNQIRPGLVRRALAGEPIRIWSAGCSSGEEVYSLTMTLLGEDRTEANRLARCDIVVLASDLADHALATARAATYPLADMDAVPPRLRQLWIEPNDGAVRIAEPARNLVRFRPLNLLGPWPIRGLFDVIFCRNVMIYFDQPTKERLLERFCEHLADDGTLYIGHSERVTGAAAAIVEPAGNTIYQRRAA
jgi:chemotaxis protein methyltransferase CheR